MLDFNKLEKYKENNRIEAKQAVGGLPQSIWESYSAFANAQGGVILLGVEETEDKTLRAVELPAPEKIITEFWDILNDPLQVSKNILSPDDVQVRRADGKIVVAVYVPQADVKDKPVYIGRDVYQGTYIRKGEGDCRCSCIEIEKMLEDAERQKKYD